MKKIMAALAVLLLVVCAYAVGLMQSRKVISIPPAQWTEGSDAADAWREFTTSLEAGGASVFSAAATSKDQLEGVQYLAQLASAALEMKLAKGDQAEPAFTDWMGDYRKFLGDSPDAVYHTAELSAKYRYEIKGNRGDAEYLGFMLYGNQLNGWNRAAANISSENMTFDDEGNFSILLSQSQPRDWPGDWLQLESDVHMVMVRQYFHGKQGKAESRFNIRNLDAPEYQPPSESDVAASLRNATSFFNDTLNGAIALGSMLSQAPNKADPPKAYSPEFGGVFYPTFDNEYFGSWFYLEDDEALVIEAEVPDADYWSVSIQNRWMQSLDYKHYQVGLNNHQITQTDGRYRVIVSHKKPPSGDWIDTAGQREGLLAIRYQLTQDSEKPALSLVKFSELAPYKAEEEGAALVGSTKDEYGCISSAGYRWCEKSGQCERSWELAERESIENTKEAFNAFCELK
ncbi:MAG: DUF1214 domain-containing protein [Halioglobus sp.]